MRGILLELIIVALAGTALFKPRVGLLGWIWFGVMHPDLFAWIPNANNASLVLAITTLVGSVRHLPQAACLVMNPVSRWLILLLVPSGLSVMFAVRPDLATTPFTDYLRMMVLILLIPLLIRTTEQLRTLFAVVALSLGAIGIKFGLWGLIHGGARFSEGFGGLDNNTLAAALVIGVPLCWYTAKLYESRLVKGVFLFTFTMLLAAVVMTHSRGAALALGGVFLLIALRSRRKFGFVLVLLLAAGPAVYMVRDSYFSRLSTLKSPEEERSSLSRLVSARAAVRMWRDYPVLGVGFGATNQMQLMGRYVDQQGISEDLVVHNTYLQVLADSGIFAFLIYLMLLFGTMVRLGLSARRMRKEHPGLEIYPAAIQTALAGWAIATIFLSRVQSDVIYILLMAAAGWYFAEKQILAEAVAPAESPGGQVLGGELACTP